MLAEAQRAAMHGEGSAIDELGAGFGERAFVEVGKLFVEFAGQRQLQHGVAEKFQPLVVLHGRTLFVRDGRMRERQPQAGGVMKEVTQSGLKRGEVGHESDRKHRTSNIEHPTSKGRATPRALNVRRSMFDVRGSHV